MPRVLVVDDEAGVRTALGRGLTAEGLDVVTAADGPTALRAALTGSFDLILLDIIIPGLSGYRVLELLVDPGTKQVSWAGRPVELSPREFAVLYALASRPDTVLSKDELLRLAWGGEQAASRNAVEVYVGYLRR